MKRLVLGLLLLLVAPGWGEVVIDPPDWEMTEPVTLEQRVERLFSVANQGDEPVEVMSVASPGGFHVVLDQNRLQPGETTNLRVEFSPAELPGVRDGPVKAEVALILSSFQNQAVIRISGHVDEPQKLSPVVPEEHHYDIRELQPGEQPFTVHYFFNGGCGSCLEFNDRVMRPLQAYFQNIVTWHNHDFSKPEEQETFSQFRARYQLGGMASNTLLFFGKHALIEKDAIEEQAYELFLAELRQPTAPPSPESTIGPPLPTPVETPETVFRSYTVGMILGVGVIDGLNPCAFATAVFLIAMLTRLGHDRRMIVAAGLAFTAAVFVTYLLIGLGVARSLAAVGVGGSARAGDVMRWLIVGLTSAFALLQVRDVVLLRGGGATRDLTMQLPLRAKQAVHRFIREGLGRPLLLVGAAGAGVLVMLLEFICTGQLYVPTIAAMLQQPELRERAVGLLLVYNLGFILPLLVILGLVTGGLSSERLAAAARRHLVPAKIALAVLLFALAAFVAIGPKLA